MICIPIIAKGNREALDKMGKAGALTVDLFEIRLDLMETYDLEELVRISQKPLISTYRSEGEGGKGDTNYGIRAEKAINAIRAGAGFVDVEMSLPPEWREKIMAAKEDTKVIASSHFFNGTPSSTDLHNTLLGSHESGADVVKIVTMANSWEDNLRVLELIPEAQELGVRIIAFCMGPSGRISRVLSSLMGGFLTFASLEEGQESAAGQIPVEEMKKLLDYFRV